MLCSIDITKPNDLQFSLQVSGSGAKSIEPRFIIIGEDFAVVCMCKPEKDIIKVSVPKLDGILKPGKYPVRFEVILDEQLVTPLKDTIELTAVSVEAKLIEPPPAAVIKADPPKPKTKLIKAAKPAPVKEAVEEPVVVEENIEIAEAVVQPPEIDTSVLFNVQDAIARSTAAPRQDAGSFSIFKQFKT